MFKKKEVKQEFNPKLIPPLWVAGAYYYQKEIMSFGRLDKRFNMTAEELLEKGVHFGKIINEYFINLKDLKLVPEPTNQHNKDAIMVVNKDVKIGYISEDMLPLVRNALSKYDIDYIKASVSGGRNIELVKPGKVLMHNDGDYDINLYITLKERPVLEEEKKSFFSKLFK